MDSTSTPFTNVNSCESFFFLSHCERSVLIIVAVLKNFQMKLMERAQVVVVVVTKAVATFFCLHVRLLKGLLDTVLFDVCSKHVFFKSFFSVV